MITTPDVMDDDDNYYVPIADSAAEKKPMMKMTPVRHLDESGQGARRAVAIAPPLEV